MLTQSMVKRIIYFSVIATAIGGAVVPQMVRAEIRTLEQATSPHDQLIHQLIMAACTSDQTIAVKVKNLFFQANGRTAEGMALGTVVASIPTATLQNLLENLSTAQYFTILEALSTKFFNEAEAKPFYLTDTTHRCQKDIFVALGKSLVTCATKSSQIDQPTRDKLAKLRDSLHRVEEVKTANLVTIGNLARQFRNFADLLPAHAQNQLRAIGIFDVPSMVMKTKGLLEKRINS